MREIKAAELTEKVRELFLKANIILPSDTAECIKKACARETNGAGAAALRTAVKNLEAAEKNCMPICQDTGMAVVFLKIGQDVHIVGGDVIEAVNNGVKKAYVNGLLRKSVVIDPLNRVNTKDNTPAIIHTEIVPGNKIEIMAAPKGFGSENMSGIKMLLPSSGKKGVVDAVLDIVKKAGSNPCPPMVVGVGIGGDFEQSALLSKKALCRNLDEPNNNPFYAEMEKELLSKINSLDIGPQGFGGNTTALGVNIEVAPAHIAGLPVAVNIGCHVTRHKSAVI